ncbi:MAG: UDP-2,3-diacylglucosamine diphosphatase [Halothiobacillaceae bacterium]
MPTLSYRSVFVSDLHLGTADAQAEYLLDFLDHVECEYLFLNGDIFDIWKMRTRRWRWPQIKTRLLQRLVGLASRGVRVIYVPGNHDAFFRDYLGCEMAGVEVHREYQHRLADGRRALVLHGDEFDGLVRHNRLLKLLGNGGYELLMWLNRINHHWRRRSGRSYWSLSSAVKNQVPNARVYVDKFEQAAIGHARERGFDAVICGHIHKANLRQDDGVTYANSGDWVEHCTALVEQADGRLELIDWARDSGQLIDRAAGRQSEEMPAVADPVRVPGVLPLDAMFEGRLPAQGRDTRRLDRAGH